ncbi:hypothetical protein [Achromobacter phage CF418P1]|nr:hypothetical protein [Achromobacter phage CF418P1]
MHKNKKPPALGQGLFDTGLVGFFLAQHNPERATVRATDDPSLYGNSHPIDDFFGVVRLHRYAPKRRPNFRLDI